MYSRYHPRRPHYPPHHYPPHHHPPHHHPPHHHPPHYPPHHHPPHHPPRPVPVPIPGRTLEECCISSDEWNGALDDSCSNYETDLSCNQLSGYCQWRNSPNCPKSPADPPCCRGNQPEMNDFCQTLADAAEMEHNIDGVPYVDRLPGAQQTCEINPNCQWHQQCPINFDYDSHESVGGLEVRRCLNGKRFLCHGGTEGCSFNSPKYCAPVVPNRTAYFCMHQDHDHGEGENMECVPMPIPEGAVPMGDNSSGFATIEDCYDATRCQAP